MTEHKHRCNICGREWPCMGECALVEFLRCLACGATIQDMQSQPDGIDFKSQHTESGEPENEQEN